MSENDGTPPRREGRHGTETVLAVLESTEEDDAKNSIEVSFVDGIQPFCLLPRLTMRSTGNQPCGLHLSSGEEAVVLLHVTNISAKTQPSSWVTLLPTYNTLN